MKDEEIKMELKNPTIHQKNENCQVFNGPISGCVFAMPGATVNQSPVQKVSAAKPEKQQYPASGIQEQDGEMFHFVHPEIEEKEGWQIHNAVKRLVAHQKIVDICKFLKDLKDKRKILLPQNPGDAYKELVRMGMPKGDGFSEKHFANSYLK